MFFMHFVCMITIFTLPVRASQPLYFWTFQRGEFFQNKKCHQLPGLCVCVCPRRMETCSSAVRHSAKNLRYFLKSLHLNWDAGLPADSCVQKRLWCHLALPCLLFCYPTPPPSSAPGWPLFQMISLNNNVHYTAETSWKLSSMCATFQLLFSFFLSFCACGFMCTGFNR